MAKVPINQAKVDAINAKVKPTPTPAPATGVINQEKQINDPLFGNATFEQKQDLQQNLEQKIKSGNFTAHEAAAYNKLTQNNQGARETMLTSPTAINNEGVQTTITQDEAQKMQDAGITKETPISSGIKLEQSTQAPVETTKVTTETTPTGTIKTTETPTLTSKIETIDQFKQAGGGLSNLEQLVENRYGTVATQEANGSLTATINGEKFKWTLDASGNPIKQSLGRAETLTPESIYNTLISGGQVDPNNKGYTEAKSRFDIYSKYKDFTDKQFQSAFNEGLILPGTQLYNDLSKNPKIKLQMDKANALNRVNGEKTDINKIYETQSEEIGNNTKVDINGQTMTLSKALSDGYISQDEYNQFTNTPEVTSKLQEVEDLKNKADELQNIYDNIRTEVENELKGTGATKSDLESIVGERQKNMLGNLNLAISKYNNALGTLTELKKTNSEMFATNLSLYQQQQQRQQQLEDLQTQRAYDLYKTQQSQQYQTAQDLQNFEQQKELLKLQQDYQDANIQTDLIQVGNKNVLINRKTGETIKSFDLPTENQTTQYGFSNVGDGTIAVTDPKTGKVTFQNSKGQTIKATPTDLISTPDGTILDSRLSSTTNPNGGKECGEFVNDITGIGLGDTLQSKLNKMETKATNSYEAIPANIGDVAVWVPDPTNKAFSKYGHAGIIIGEEGDNWIIKSSNIKGDGAVSTDKVPKQTIMGVSGKYDKSKLQGGPTTGGDIQTLGQFLKDNQSRGPGYSEEDVKAFDSKIDRFIQNNDEKGMALAFRKNIFEDKDFKQEFDNTKKFQTGLTQVEKLISDYEKAGKSTNALKAMAEKVARTTGLTTDEALAQMQTQMGFVLANYIKSISGTAASDAEVQRLMGNMANISNVSSLNKTILSQVKSNSQASLESMIDTRMYGLPESFKYKAFEDIYGTKEKTTTGTSAPKIYNNVNDIKKDFLNY